MALEDTKIHWALKSILAKENGRRITNQDCSFDEQCILIRLKGSTSHG